MARKRTLNPQGFPTRRPSGMTRPAANHPTLPGPAPVGGGGRPYPNKPSKPAKPRKGNQLGGRSSGPTLTPFGGGPQLNLRGNPINTGGGKSSLTQGKPPASKPGTNQGGAIKPGVTDERIDSRIAALQKKLDVFGEGDEDQEARVLQRLRHNMLLKQFGGDEYRDAYFGDIDGFIPRAGEVRRELLEQGDDADPAELARIQALTAQIRERRRLFTPEVAQGDYMWDEATKRWVPRRAQADVPA